MGNNYLPANVGVCGNCLLHKLLMLFPFCTAGVYIHKQHVIIGKPIVASCGAVTIAFAVYFGVGVIKVVFIEIGIVIVITYSGRHRKRGKLSRRKKRGIKRCVGGFFHLISRRNKQRGFGKHA